MVKCLSCGATYEPIGADGVRYFHACAPIFDDRTKIYVEIANRRDENVDLTKDAASRDRLGQRKPGTTDESLMRATGAGVQKL